MNESSSAPPSVVMNGTSFNQRDTDWHGYIRDVAAGDAAALSSLYEESCHLVYGIALRVLGDTADAEEVTGDVYSQVWRKAATFQDSRGSATAWLVMLARSRAIDRVRTRVRSELEDPIIYAEGLEGDQESPEQASTRSEQRRQILQALKSLPAEQRDAIMLAFYSGFTQSELSAKLGLPLGTVKTRIRLALMKLRGELAHLQPGAPC
ncbi:MAG TPA: sigma-70 family RNA polymerase sigma factor [Bryobacteraceae bacterium]|nr:sigma-70 family RNA polymerase sigma factor [Bryobacteraceae bacterium]